MKRLYIIGVAVLIFLVVLIYFTWPRDIITKVEPNLSVEQRAIFEQQLIEGEQKVREINKDISLDEKAIRYSLLGRANYNLGNYSEAHSAFEKAVKTKRNIPIYLEYYNLLTAMHDYEEARDIARDGLKIYPINIDIWRSLIALERSQFGADDTKITGLHLEAIDTSNRQYKLLGDFARYQEEKGNFQEALKYWKEASEKAPEAPFYAEQVKRLESRH